MSSLENRIPPPLVLIITLLGMQGISMLISSSWQHVWLNWLGVAFAISGVSIAIAGVLAFRKAQTTINPLDPSRATQLVTTGIFRLSRNPMYLGMVLLAFGWGLALANPWSIALVALFALYLNRFQIVPEERAMRDLFGGDFEHYCIQTSRWI